MTADLGSPLESPDPGPLFASFAARVRAWLIDLAILAAILIVVIILGGFAKDVPGSGRVLLATLIAVPLLYEPIWVSRYGATIGHRRTNLRVVADGTKGNPGFLRALARFLIKAVLGVPSFVAMAVTPRHQALHDQLTDTTVQLRDAALAQPGDFQFARPEAPDRQLPSRGRRSIVVLLYLFGLFLLNGVAMSLLLSETCLVGERCTDTEHFVSTVVGVAWLVASVLCIVTGIRGQLPGARGRPIADTRATA
jgi:uncharacterized RDD family membrane protein YckC